MSDWYILDNDRNPVKTSIDKYIEWEKGNPDARKLRRDEVGESRISTVFLGLDHSWGDEPPVLWETLVMGGDNSDYMERYTSEADAIAGHNSILKNIMDGKIYNYANNEWLITNGM